MSHIHTKSESARARRHRLHREIARWEGVIAEARREILEVPSWRLRSTWLQERLHAIAAARRVIAGLRSQL